MTPCRLFPVRETRHNFHFKCRNTIFFLRISNSFYHERHVRRQIPHRLEPFAVLCDILCSKTVDHVPVSACRYRHAAYRKIFVEDIERSSISASAAAYNGCSDLKMFRKTAHRAVEKPVEEGNKCSVRRTEINRTSDNKTVSLFKFRRSFIHEIVKNALAAVSAGIAGNTSADIFVSDMNKLGPDAVFSKNLHHFIQSCRRAAVNMRTAVQQKYFCHFSPCLRLLFFSLKRTYPDTVSE